MMKLLYGIGVLAMVCAGVPLSLCGMQWWKGTPQGGGVPEVSVVERAHSLGELGPDGNRDVMPPLVVQATAFALHLNPPKPPPPREVPQPRTLSPQPALRPVATTPKFRLLSTSLHHSDPEQSLALISEPGKGDHWLRQGDRVGHLLVESISDGRLVYRDGGQLSEMAVATKHPAELARSTSGPAASTRSFQPDARLVNASRTSEPGIRAMDTLPAGYEQD